MIGRVFPPKSVETAEPKGFDDFDLRLGDIMRGERATLGKSLLDVQRELKIKATYIAAIENADPSAFETPGFIAGYVRSYARYLTLDPEWAYSKFCKEGNFAIAHGMSSMASSPNPARETRRKAADDRDPFANPNAAFVPRKQKMFASVEPGALGSIAVLLMLMSGLGYGGWSVLQEVQKVQFVPVDQAPGVVSNLDPLSGTEIALAERGAGSGAATPFEAPSIESMDRLYRPQALDVPVLVARDGPIAALDPSSLGNLIPEGPERLASLVTNTDETSAPAAAPVEAVQVIEPQAAEVVLLAVRPAWVRVRGADGVTLFEKILDAGEEYALPKTEEPPTLRAGNSGSVYFKVAGQTYGPAGPGTSTAKNVALSPESLTGAYTVADIATDSDLAKIVAVAQAQTLPVTE